MITNGDYHCNKVHSCHMTIREFCIMEVIIRDVFQIYILKYITIMLKIDI